MEVPEPFAPLRTLIIDPDVYFLRELKSMVINNPLLELSQICKTGRAAGNFLKSNEVDLILLNPALPDKNGFDMITHLNKVPPTIVIADRQDYAYYAFRIGAFDYRVKPLSLDQFNASLDRVFRAYRQQRALEKANLALETTQKNPA